MNLDLRAVLALILAFIVITDARITTKTNLDEKNLPKIDEDKTGVLNLDEDDYSGDYEDDDEYYYDDEDEDDYDYEEGSGEDDSDEILPKKEKEIDMMLEVLKISESKDGEFHFDEDEKPDKKNKDSDLLSEYYDEIYEEDYEIGLSDVENPIVQKTPTEPQEVPEQEGGFSYTNILMMVASGVISFGIFTLVFVLFCCNRRGGKGATKQKNLAAVRLGSPEKTVHTVVRPSGYHVVPPPSSIVKNYHLVPQDAVEFLSTSSSTQTGMENSSHIINEKNEPLLP